MLPRCCDLLISAILIAAPIAASAAPNQAGSRKICIGASQQRQSAIQLDMPGLSFGANSGSMVWRPMAWDGSSTPPYKSR